MRLKIIFGIVLPVLLIILLAIVGSLDIGFSTTKTFVKQITVKDIVSDGSLRNTLKLGEYNFKNEYFLGKRYSLKPLMACLVDKESVKQNYNAGNVFYSEGDYSPGKEVFYSDNSQELSVEISAGSKKTVTIYINPSYSYYQNYTQLLEQFKEIHPTDSPNA